jgi:RND superfamily putative drug exporter
MFRSDHRSHRNLAARMGSWSASHWKTATFGWLALVLLAFAVGSQVGTKQADPNRAGPRARTLTPSGVSWRAISPATSCTSARLTPFA